MREIDNPSPRPAAADHASRSDRFVDRTSTAHCKWNKENGGSHQRCRAISATSRQESAAEVHIAVDKFSKYEIVAQTLRIYSTRPEDNRFVNNDFFSGSRAATSANHTRFTGGYVRCAKCVADGNGEVPASGKAITPPLCGSTCPPRRAGAPAQVSLRVLQRRLHLRVSSRVRFFIVGPGGHAVLQQHAGDAAPVSSRRSPCLQSWPETGNPRRGTPPTATPVLRPLATYTVLSAD